METAVVYFIETLPGRLVRLTENEIRVGHGHADAYSSVAECSVIPC